MEISSGDTGWEKLLLCILIVAVALVFIEKCSGRRETRRVPSLTIATDATPDNVGGYCIDFATNSCAYYSFPTAMLPQCLKVRRYFNSAEFEMNNLAFALLLWEPLILERQRLRVYTDNNSIRENGIKPEHGEKVRAYLGHLEKYGGVRVLNKWKHHINQNYRPADFEKYIRPADDLSRGNIDAFIEKIQESFPRITDFSELCTISVLANQVQERWEKNGQEQVQFWGRLLEAIARLLWILFKFVLTKLGFSQ